MSLRIAIVEDSQENIDILKYLLEKSDAEIEVIGVAKTIDEAKLLLSRPDIDLAFLDIQLKEGTIFDVLEEVVNEKSLPFEIVFVTAHGTYENALKGIQYACLEFINKPIDQEELLAAIKKADSKKSVNTNGEERVKYLLDIISNQIQQPSKLGLILSKGVIEFVEMSEIEYFEADQTICRVFLNDGRRYSSAKHLGYYIQLLHDNSNFIQASKSHLINLSRIKQYDHRERTIKFESGNYVIASHRLSVDVKKAIMEKQGGNNFLRGGWNKLTDLFK